MTPVSIAYICHLRFSSSFLLLFFHSSTTSNLHHRSPDLLHLAFSFRSFQLSSQNTHTYTQWLSTTYVICSLRYLQKKDSRIRVRSPSRRMLLPPSLKSTYPSIAPSSTVSKRDANHNLHNRAKEKARSEGGTIKHEYTLIKGFTWVNQRHFARLMLTTSLVVSNTLTTMSAFSRATNTSTSSKTERSLPSRRCRPSLFAKGPSREIGAVDQQPMPLSAEVKAVG